jgi:hypothetical protein
LLTYQVREGMDPPIGPFEYLNLIVLMEATDAAKLELFQGVSKMYLTHTRLRAEGGERARKRKLRIQESNLQGGQSMRNNQDKLGFATADGLAGGTKSFCSGARGEGLNHQSEIVHHSVHHSRASWLRRAGGEGGGEGRGRPGWNISVCMRAGARVRSCARVLCVRVHVCVRADRDDGYVRACVCVRHTHAHTYISKH